MRLALRQQDRRYTVRQIESSGLSYVYCEISGSRGFIVGNKYIIEKLKGQKMIYVSILEKKKLTHMEQHMGALKSGNYSRYKEVMHNYVARIIGESNSNQPYKLWEIV